MDLKIGVLKGLIKVFKTELFSEKHVLRECLKNSGNP